MSNSVFPLPVAPNGSWTWPIKKFPTFSTITQTSASRRAQLRVSLTPYPIWIFELDFSYLKGDENVQGSALQSILGFYGQMFGAADDWLWPDPFDNSVSQMTFGVGDGVTQSFQLIRKIAGMTDIIQNLNGTPTIFDAGLTTLAFSLNGLGVVTFNTPPVAGHVLSWTGSYYFRCHFLKDELSDLQRTMFKLWSLRSLQFESIIL